MKPLPAIATILLSLMPGCRCTTTEVSYGEGLDPAIENQLAELLEDGVRRCAREGESDVCVSEGHHLDKRRTVKDFRLTLGRSSCRADAHAQVEAIAVFRGGFSVVAGTFSQDWMGRWVLDRVEFLGFPDHFRICETFGERYRHEDVTVIFGDDIEEEPDGPRT